MILQKNSKIEMYERRKNDTQASCNLYNSQSHTLRPYSHSETAAPPHSQSHTATRKTGIPQGSLSLPPRFPFVVERAHRDPSVSLEGHGVTRTRGSGACIRIGPCRQYQCYARQAVSSSRSSYTSSRKDALPGIVPCWPTFRNRDVRWVQINPEI